jgi:Spy/CpxP family protein refolding chaperone
MKRSMVLVTAIMMISSVIFAQTKDKHQRNGARQAEKFKSELSLDATQYASIKDINKKYGAHFAKLRLDSTTGRNEKHTLIRNLRDDKEKEIVALLTADQKTKYEKLKAVRAEKRNERMQARSEKHHAQMVKELSLTNDQSVKMKNAHKAFREKAKLLREESRSGKEANKEEFRKLRKDHVSTLQSILTPDQFSKWKAMRKSMKGKHKGGKR